MRVILTEDVKGTGKKGDVVEVKDGYGRNFLIPKGLALPASEGNIKKFEHVLKEFEKKKERQIKHAEDIKAKLEGLTITIKKKAGQDGRLFGSVTPQELSDLIKNTTGLEIDKKKIRIDESIKSTGMHTFAVHLEKGIVASIKLEVEKEE